MGETSRSGCLFSLCQRSHAFTILYRCGVSVRSKIRAKNERNLCDTRAIVDRRVATAVPATLLTPYTHFLQ